MRASRDQSGIPHCLHESGAVTSLEMAIDFGGSDTVVDRL